jgi:phage-related holin
MIRFFCVFVVLGLLQGYFFMYFKFVVLVLKCFMIARLQESLLICGIVCQKSSTRRTMMH